MTSVRWNDIDNLRPETDLSTVNKTGNLCKAFFMRKHCKMVIIYEFLITLVTT